MSECRNGERTRFLLAREGDVQWERNIDNPKPRPKLDQFFRESLAEGSEPLEKV